MSLKAKILYRGRALYWWLVRPLTMGVKLMLIRDDKVLLVKHSYQPGWHLPGGGVSTNETLEAAARREASEELGAQLGDLNFFGIFSRLNGYNSDHVVVFVCQDFVLEGPTDYEIEAYDFYPFNALPKEMTGGGRQRIHEYFAGRREPRVSVW